ncbi:hypothetical protein PLICRDRAFT_36770 [Plicaturopsis crispa FD-325 SS-3]|nr:hypothetical protein PLICRDRAFT_36770 [Plicaturopsis crispa FD-325 SS-3]
MLPIPVSLSSRRSYRRLSSSANVTGRQTLDTLRTRARITNLGLVLLTAFAAISALLNLIHYFSSESPVQRPSSIASTIARNSAVQSLDHLVIVPGHSIWKGKRGVAGKGDDDEWLLEPYQRGSGRVAAFFSHISRGAEIAVNDKRSLLVFSGGQTRTQSTTTEAESYLRLALAAGLLPSSDGPFLRATTEEHALDSYQNLLFSIARFHEYTGRYPTSITVVGYEMKRRRFTELHRAALRWPLARFRYIGVDPLGTEAQDGELQNGYKPYTADLYGCHSYLLAKRRSRNPFARFHSYHTSAPELRGLLEWCPASQTALYPGALPWDRIAS